MIWIFKKNCILSEHIFLCLIAMLESHPFLHFMEDVVYSLDCHIFSFFGVRLPQVISCLGLFSFCFPLPLKQAPA